MFCFVLVSLDLSDKLRQPKIGALMKQVMGNKDDVPGTFSRGGEEREHMTACVCVRERECVCYPLWCCLMDHICCLTSALSQRAKVISLSQPKVSGKARTPSRGTVGPAHLPLFHSYLTNQILVEWVWMLWVLVACFVWGLMMRCHCLLWSVGFCVCMLLLQLWCRLCHFMFWLFIFLNVNSNIHGHSF